MSGLCIGDLRQHVRGKLSLATLPPLSGLSEPLGRIVTRLADVRTGDVYWDVANVRASGAANAEEAFSRGALGVVTGRPHAEPWAGCFSMEVDNPRDAIIQLIAAARREFTGALIAVAGHLGKSTTLHLIRAALEQGEAIGAAEDATLDQGARLARLANALAGTDETLLVEIGGASREEAEAQIAWLQPDVLVLPSAPLDPSPVAQGTSTRSRMQRLIDMLDQLSGDRQVVVNGDEELLRHAAEYTMSRSISVGRGAHCDVVASAIECRDGRLSCEVDGQRLSVPLWGRHQVPFMLAAYAVGRILNRPAAQLADGLRNAPPLPKRCEVIQTSQYTVINDTGNGRPTTLVPALELLRDIPTPGRRIVVCGELSGEPDPASRDCRQVGEAIVSRCGADWLVTWGHQAGTIIHAARTAGLPAGRAVRCQNAEDGRHRLASLLGDGDVVLVKGAPGPAMQQFVQELLGQTETVSSKAPPSARDSRESRAALPPG